MGNWSSDLHILQRGNTSPRERWGRRAGSHSKPDPTAAGINTRMFCSVKKGKHEIQREWGTSSWRAQAGACVCWDWPPWSSPEICSYRLCLSVLSYCRQTRTGLGFALLCTCLQMTVVQWGMAEQPKLPLALISPVGRVRASIHLFATQLEKKVKHLHSSLLQ